MRGLNAIELLETWESGRGRPPIELGLELLARARPGEAERARLELPVDERDLALFELRARTFGHEALLRSRCPKCGTELEGSLDLTDVLRLGGERRVEPVDSSARPPTSADLLAVAGLPAGEAERLLRERCHVSSPGEGEQLALRHPLLVVSIPFTCVECASVWEEPFDVVQFFWKEIDACAVRLLREVHCLARAYGWNESEILGLSPARRATYLSLAGA